MLAPVCAAAVLLERACLLQRVRAAPRWCQVFQALPVAVKTRIGSIAVSMQAQSLQLCTSGLRMRLSGRARMRLGAVYEVVVKDRSLQYSLSVQKMLV